MRLLLLSALYLCPAFAQPVPNSWSKGTPVLIPTGGVKINGMFFKASGDAPHPTAIYLHGLPGFSGDLDLPVPMSAAGWNVLTLHYRGSWGSQGDYSYAHQIEDAKAAITFVRDASNARTFSIDTRRVVLIGHSTGGLIAMITAATTSGLEGLVLISASDDSAEAVDRYKTPAARDALRNSNGTPCSGPLTGCTSRDLELDALDNAASWTFAALAPKLAKIPILMITSDDPYARENDGLASAITPQAGAQLVRVHLKTDHAYTTLRAALAKAVVDWLSRSRIGTTQPR